MTTIRRWSVAAAIGIVAATIAAILIAGGTESVPLSLAYPAIVLLAFRFGPVGGTASGLGLALCSAGLPLEAAAAEYPALPEILIQAAVLGSLGWLSGQLFRMMQRQADSLAELTRTLDAKVEERSRQLSTANGDLQAALAQRDELLTIIAHDLRAPFNGIIGFSSFLASKGADMPRDKILSYVDLIHDGATQAHHLLESLLEWARLRAAGVPAKAGRVAASRLLEHAVTVAGVSAVAKDIRLEVAVPPGDIAILADQDQIATVLRNLLSNAVKFTPRGGVIRLGLTTDGQGRAVYSIHDSGVGMTEDQVATVYTPLTRRATRGTDGESGSGFGLGICRRYVELNGGDMDIDSAPEQGTRVTVALPLAEGGALPLAEGGARSAAGAGGAPKETGADNACLAG